MVNQTVYNVPNMAKKKFRFVADIPFSGCGRDGSIIPAGTGLKLFAPRNTFAQGIAADGQRFVAKSDWIRKVGA